MSEWTDHKWVIWLATDATEFGTRFSVSDPNYSLLQVLKWKTKNRFLLNALTFTAFYCYTYLLAESRLRWVERPLAVCGESTRDSARDSATVGKLQEFRVSIKLILLRSVSDVFGCCELTSGSGVVELPSVVIGPLRCGLCCWRRAKICPISRTIRYSNCSSCLEPTNKKTR